jgi:hypothetical protein
VALSARGARARRHRRGTRRLSEEALYALCTGAPPAMRQRVVRYASDDRHRRLPVTHDVAMGLAGPAIGRA